MGDLGGDCGCIGGMCGCGMGQFESPMTWALIAGLAVLGLWLAAPGGKEHREAQRRLKESYHKQSAQLRSKHRGYRRVVRGAAGAVQRGVQAVQAV